MYSLPKRFGGAELAAGTSLLITGPPMTGKRRIGLNVLATGAAAGDGAIVVTTKDDAERVLEDYRSLAGDDPDDTDHTDLGIVDCVSRQQGVEELTDARTTYVSSPEDMTGIGIKFSELLEEFHANRGLSRNRVLFHSITALLLYSNPETVFRFLHVFTGRIRSVGGLGVFVIESTVHDDRTMGTIQQLFDGVIEVADDAEPDVRLPGVAN
jgi:KaiC/GvpD/RAD55 family RecA-like ATPase